jgi:hypothetical protein
MWAQLTLDLDFDMIDITIERNNNAVVSNKRLEVEADTPEQAIEEVNRIEQAEDIEEYAYEWGSLDIEEMEELGEEE